MKKSLAIILTILLLLVNTVPSLASSPILINKEWKGPNPSDHQTDAEIVKVLKFLDIKMYNLKKQKLNFAVYKKYSAFVYGDSYGDIALIKDNTKQGKHSEPRYLGFNFEGEPFHNEYFPDDGKSNKDPRKRRFACISGARESWEKVKPGLVEPIMNSPLKDNGEVQYSFAELLAYECKSYDEMKDFVLVQQVPTLCSAGYFLMEHTGYYN